MRNLVFFSTSNKSFHPFFVPADAFEISESDYKAIMIAQENGQSIQISKDGLPIMTRQPSEYEVWDDQTESWVITEEKQAHIDEMNNQQRIYELEAEKADVSASMMKNMLLGKNDEAKADAMHIEEIEAEIEKLKE